MQVRCYVKNVRISPRKVRLVLDTIRGKKVDEAAGILKFTRTGAAGPIAKALKSAVSNAVNNNGAIAENLYVVKCFADDGVTLKRWMPRAKGSASQILKRSSHITIVVGDKAEEPKVEEKKEVVKEEPKKEEPKKVETKKAETKKAETAEKKPAAKKTTTTKKTTTKKTTKKEDKE